MICDEGLTADCLITMTSVWIAIITAIVLIVSLTINRKQLFVQNFSEATSHIGDELTKLYRKWILYDKSMEQIFNDFKSMYNEKYDTLSDDNRQKYKLIEKAIWHLASRYDRLGVLLEQDGQLKYRFLEYHCQVISKLWTKLESIIDKRKEITGEDAYKYFRKIGKDAVRYQEGKSSKMKFMKKWYGIK